MQAYKIILAEDHLLFRQVIKKVIENNDELTVVGEANDGLELLELLRQLLPDTVIDMVITDISMPRLRGLQAAKKVKELYPQIKVLILTVHNGKDFLDRARLNGVDGFLLKQEMDEELYPAIQSVRRGKFYISPSLNRIHDQDHAEIRLNPSVL
jgi:DNA-binding NarL/FixJ family response regulator